MNKLLIALLNKTNEDTRKSNLSKGDKAKLHKVYRNLIDALAHYGNDGFIKAWINESTANAKSFNAFTPILFETGKVTDWSMFENKYLSK